MSKPCPAPRPATSTRQGGGGGDATTNRKRPTRAKETLSPISPQLRSPRSHRAMRGIGKFPDERNTARLVEDQAPDPLLPGEQGRSMPGNPSRGTTLVMGCACLSGLPPVLRRNRGLQPRDLATEHRPSGSRLPANTFRTRYRDSRLCSVFVGAAAGPWAGTIVSRARSVPRLLIIRTALRPRRRAAAIAALQFAGLLTEDLADSRGPRHA